MRPTDSRADTLADAADRRERIIIIAGQIGIGVGFLVAWQVVSGLWVDRFFLSEPSLIVERIIELAVSGELWLHLRATMLETSTSPARSALSSRRTRTSTKWPTAVVTAAS